MSGTQVQRDEWVGRVLGVRIEAAATRPDGAAVRMAQGMLLWNGTRSYVSQQVSTLQAAILAKTAGEPDFPEIQSGIVKLEALLTVLDDSLSVKLNELRGMTDIAAKRKTTDEARSIVEGYQKYLAEDALVNAIDDNGFVKLDIKARVTSTLQAVLQTI